MKYPLQVRVERFWRGATFAGFTVTARLDGYIVERVLVGPDVAEAERMRASLKRRFAPVRDALK